MIAPKAFKGKDKEAETLLIDFDLYVKTITNFFIATGKDTANDRQKVALLQAVGGPDMVDLVEEVGKVTLVATAADVANEVAAVEADSFEQAIEKIRQGIVGKTNQAMSRLKLFQRMGQGTQKFASWYKEVFKQAKRCDWSTYNVEEAARDAIMYQTTDQKLRKKILAQNMSYQETVAWGQSHEESDRKAQLVEETTDKVDRVRRLETQLGRLQAKQKSGPSCQTCSRPRHTPDQPCPGTKCTECHACKQSGHFIGAPICPGPTKDTKTGAGKMEHKKKKKKVRKVASDSEESSDQDETDTETIGRIETITVGAAGQPSDEVVVRVGVRPRGTRMKVWTQWTADSGVKKTLLSEDDWGYLKEHNPTAKLKKNTIRFVPYGTRQSLPVRGKARVMLQCEEGMRVYTTVYVVAGQTENLLGERDAVALGILAIKPRGSKAKKEEGYTDQGKAKKETVANIHVVKKETPTAGNVSGGQSQTEIDRDMEAVLYQFRDMFDGIGEIKLPPIEIFMKEGARPVAQKQRPIPIHLMEPLREKLEMFVREGVLEGPLESEHARGWVHNVVLTKKKWNEKAIRLNIDTRAMEKYVDVTHFPIPTPEQIRHQFLGSDRFTVLDLNDSFHQLKLADNSKDLFKFTTPFGLFRFNRLVMGAHAASAECHAKLSKVLHGLPGVVQIKDDVCIHGAGREHDKRVLAVLHRLQEYGITLRREKCKLGQPEVIWFGNVFHKQGMSPDPEKVANIKAWPAPEDKAAVKSFLQTTQFCAPYMGPGKGRTYADITSPLRQLTAHDSR